MAQGFNLDQLLRAFSQPGGPSPDTIDMLAGIMAAQIPPPSPMGQGALGQGLMPKEQEQGLQMPGDLSQVLQPQSQQQPQQAQKQPNAFLNAPQAAVLERYMSPDRTPLPGTPGVVPSRNVQFGQYSAPPVGRYPTLAELLAGRR